MSPIISIDLVAAAKRSEELANLPAHELEQDARDYARFLRLLREHPYEDQAPTKRIDRMWHLHMLHPRAYQADCLRLIGDVLDHDGGFGGTPEEAPALHAAFTRTAALWLAKFGEPYVGETTACKRNCVSRCQRRCAHLATAD